MKILLFSALLLGISLAKPTNTISEECAACQFFNIILSNSNVNGQNALDHPVLSAVNSVCSSIPDCAIERDHCEIVSVLEHSISNLNQSAVEVRAIRESLGQASALCAQDPTVRVLQLDSGDSLAKCLLCLLVKNVLQFVNNSIAGGWMEELIMNLIKKINPADPDIPLAVVTKLVFQSLRDTMGAFYDVIAVQGMKCPPFALLDQMCMG